MTARPLPRLPRTVLRWVLPSDWRDDILRDVEEAYGRRRRGGAALRARAWLWAEVLSFSVRFLPARLSEILPVLRLSSLDFKLAFRAQVRSPGLSVLAVVSLAMGIGAAAAAFSIIEGAFFTTIPYPGGDRIVLVEDHSVSRGYPLRVRGEEYLRRKERLSTFEHLGAYHSRPLVLEGGAGPARRVTARFVTPEILELTGVAPRLGRLPAPDDAEPGAEPVMVLPHFLWASELGADPGVLGRRVELGGVPRTVIGVMPEGFAFPWGDELWIPFDPAGSAEPLRMIGKLREGVELARARAEVATVARPDPRELTSADEEVQHLVNRLDRNLTLDGQLLGLGVPLLALVLLLLVMATNVAMVVLARNAARSGELAVRSALGASRRRVVGQLALEVALLAALAAVLGLVLARRGVDAFRATVSEMPFWADFSLDVRVVAFTVGLAALTTLVAGLAPALRVTAGRLHESLKEGTGGASRVRFGRLAGALIVAELAVCVGFLATAAVLGRGLLSMGFERYDLPAEEILVSQVYFGEAEETGGGADAKRRALLRAALRLPGVRMAAEGSRFPGNESERERVEVEGGVGTGPSTTEVVAVGPGYFDLLGVSPARGRSFIAVEHEERRPVALVDEPFVEAHLGGGNAVGRRIRFPGGGEDDAAAGPWLEVVGVVPDLGLSPGDPGAAGGVYRPLGATNVLRLALRGEGSPSAWIPDLLEAVRSVDPEVQVQWAKTLEAQMREPVALFRGLGVGLLLLGAVALLLSAASLHALTAAAVTRRSRELGIRQALGARPRSVVLSVVRRAGIQVALGALLGALLSAGLLRVGAIFPWEVGSGSPLALGGVVAVLAVAVVAALVGPLRRALAIRPAEALRSE